MKFRRQLLVRIGIVSALIVATFLSVRAFTSADEPKPPVETFSALVERIEGGKVEEVTFDPEQLVVLVRDRGVDKKHAYAIGVPGDAGLERLLAAAQRAEVAVDSKKVDNARSLTDRLLQLLPTLFLIGIIALVLLTYSPIRPSKIRPAESRTTFANVAGCDEAVEELGDVREFLRNPARFEQLGARVPKGVLLIGPPGTGKTLLAKAVANEAGIPFFSTSGSEFVEMFAGLGAQRIRRLFRQAKERAPAIVFIDELDAVGRSRSGGNSDGGTREADQTLNQLLTELDGFEISEHPLIVVAASNRLDVLDPALIRPGRFDRHIRVDPPDRAGRLAVLKLHAADKKLADESELELWATQTAGMTGADLANFLNEAALIAARRNARMIEPRDLEDAFLRIVAGAKRERKTLSDRERRVVAFHEAGHAIVAERLRLSDRVHKISIIPRGDSGGQTFYVSDEDVYLQTRADILDRIAVLLAGRAAEEVAFDEVTTGAADDLKRSSEIIKALLTRHGMGEELGLLVLEEQSMEEQLARSLHEEARKLLDEQYTRSRELLTGEVDVLNRLAEALLREETLDREQFLAVIGE